jgi:hypothetical protein
MVCGIGENGRFRKKDGWFWTRCGEFGGDGCATQKHLDVEALAAYALVEVEEA